jgi:hypothetical protein
MSSDNPDYMKAVHTYQLSDGRSVTLTEEQHRLLHMIVDGRGPKGWAGRQDADTLLRNYLTYGAFEPTPEQFKAYREKRDALVTSNEVEDAQTGYANVSLPKLFGDLRSQVLALCADARMNPSALKLMFEELRRRLAVVHSQDVIATMTAKKELEAAQQEKVFAQNETEKARRAQAEYRTRALEDQALIEVLERRIAALREELPEEVAAGGRALQL